MTTTTATTTPAAASLSLKEARVPAWSLLFPVLAVAFLLLIASQQPDGRLHIWVLDVGQGDAIFLRTPKGHTALIDGGPAATPLLEGIGSHVPFWQRNIDLVVLTHPHEDHVMGLIELLSHYRVGQIVQTQFTSTVGVQGQWLHDLKDHSVPVHYTRRGETIRFEDEPDVVFHILSPTTPDASRELKGGDLNNTSVVLKLDYGKEGILLEGDAQIAAETEMVSHESADLASTVLKVGHHGSDTSSSPAFLGKVHPQVAIISVGNSNRYGHPAQSTLDALHASGAGLFRTDENGTVEIVAEKGRIWVHTER